MSEKKKIKNELQSWTKVLGQLFPSPHPTDSVETVKAQFLWSFNIVLGGKGGGDMDL